MGTGSQSKMEKIFIDQLQANQTISSTFLVKSKELRTKKTGGQFALILLADRTGEIMAQWWDNFEDSIETFDRDDIVFVRGLVNSYRNHLQITIHRMRPCQPQEVDLSQYFPTTRFDVEKMFGELIGFIAEFRNPWLRRLLENILGDEETARKFKRAPAAKTMHHPYLGGLLEHSLSLVRLCRFMASHYEGIDRDLLVTGAILHDFGKIDELSYDRAFGYTNEGQMIGHLVMETIMVAGKIAELPGFPDDLRRHLLHLLLTHHGKLEYGSPKLPSTPEALLLSMLDDLDSKVEAMQRLMADPLAVGDWTRISPMFERPIYRRRTLDPLPPTSTDQTEREQGATLSGEDQRAGADPVGRRSAGQSAGTFNTPFAGLEGLIK
jgi:3'-5' exoribonuclease